MKGKIVHFELPFDDQKRARKFYKKTFDWAFDPVPDQDYTMIQTAKSDKMGMSKEKGVINGGMAERGPPLSHPSVTVMVDDIDKAIKSIGKNGGKIVRKKMAIGDMGFVAYFKDPEGNVLGLVSFG
jgi:predicted enzyme related to lactoylglutathione lyase